jgi:hypothetical protein
MASEQADRPTVPGPILPRAGRGAARGRVLALATAAVFAVSSVFPAVAGLSKDTASFTRWWGPMDVGIAFVLAVLALAVLTLAQGKVDRQVEEASYRAYRILIHGIFAAMLVFVLAEDRVIWHQCLTGFAWRYWLLLYCLPAWFAALGAPSGRGRPVPPSGSVAP